VIGVPVVGLQLTQVAGVSIPVAPAYVKLPLSTLPLSSVAGVNYALVISFSTPVNWHSVSGNGLPDGRPEDGVATVYASWVRRGAGWCLGDE
jgi:hypothetical protein